MLPDRVSNPGPLTYESGALPIALRGPAGCSDSGEKQKNNKSAAHNVDSTLNQQKFSVD